MLYSAIYSLFVLLVFLSCCFFGKKGSILAVLVLLEVVTFGVLLLYFAPLLMMYNSMSYFVALFCFAASGAACGLSLLISMSRHSGSDLIKVLGCEKDSGVSSYIKTTKTY